MAQSPEPFFPLLGMNAQGDLAGLTFYTSKRRGLVFYAKAPPTKPPSPLQTTMRNRFRLIASVWRSLPEHLRQAWNQLAIAGSLSIHGYDLFVYYQSTKDAGCVRTLQSQTGIDVGV